ncbi:MAG: FGGY family carbohydrate kinase [Cyclobacteriaceae bacterium]
MFYIGYDIGSSSIKAAIIDSVTNRQVAVASYPSQEMSMISHQTGWAEQHPEDWWNHVCEATKLVLSESGVRKTDIAGIGISYQMHGLVVVDEHQEVLRPAIIWCDSRAVGIGEEALSQIGKDFCYSHLLNAPGNFTASKLKWVKENEPELFAKIHKIMLPGDFIAMKLTGAITTTVSGLSEGMFWDFQNHRVADFLMENLGFDQSIIPEMVPTFSNQGTLTTQAAEALGLHTDVIVGYRAGDQPNNALSLGVLNPGEIAATGGTSGVVYGVQNVPVYDFKSRVNSFAHVNHTIENQRIGVLLCINGAGIQYRWMKQMLASDEVSYDALEGLIAQIPIGSDGLSVLPFGNGAERMLSNQDIGAQINNIQFNRHTKPHFYRAALEGIAYSFVYGMEVLNELGLHVNKLRVGNDNLFRSKVFSETISTLTDAPIEMIETTGAIGAARGAAFANGSFSSLAEAVSGDKLVKEYLPVKNEKQAYSTAYENWKNNLLKNIK